jgi:hypothetical protein
VLPLLFAIVTIARFGNPAGCVNGVAVVDAVNGKLATVLLP